MASKLWEKNIQVDHDVETYTVGRDREMDLYLARYDVLGSIAHITMLQTINLLSADELSLLTAALREIYAEIEAGKFVIEDGIEDVHSQVELMLTRRLGDVGKKIHSGRSRNDQVLVDLRLFIRSEIEDVVHHITTLFHTLQAQSERYKDVLMPGYTHLQVAMPSSFGLWFGAYAESLADDLVVLRAAYDVNNRNPLGSAAGYGSSFPLNRELTTQLLGFASVDYNVVYAQMGRGKTERIVAAAIANIAATISKLAFDACMFNSQNFAFIKLPDEFTTGSSIMPHKKNPDVFELTRARCNRLEALPFQITMVTNNLPVGYFRDLQLTKEDFLPAFDEIKAILGLTDVDCKKIFTINRLENKEGRSFFREVFIRRGTTSGVYGVEEPHECYMTYTTERAEKEALKLYKKELRCSHQEAIEAYCRDWDASGIGKSLPFAQKVNETGRVLNLRPVYESK